MMIGRDLMEEVGLIVDFRKLELEWAKAHIPFKDAKATPTTSWVLHSKERLHSWVDCKQQSKTNIRCQIWKTDLFSPSWEQIYLTPDKQAKLEALLDNLLHAFWLVSFATLHSFWHFSSSSLFPQIMQRYVVNWHLRSWNLMEQSNSLKPVLVFSALQCHMVGQGWKSIGVPSPTTCDFLHCQFRILSACARLKKNLGFEAQPFVISFTANFCEFGILSACEGKHQHPTQHWLFFLIYKSHTKSSSFILVNGMLCVIRFSFYAILLRWQCCFQKNKYI